MPIDTQVPWLIPNRSVAAPDMSEPETWGQVGAKITVSGYISKLRKVSKNLAFASLERDGRRIGQIAAKGPEEVSKLSKIRPLSAVLASGTVTEASTTSHFEMDLESIKHLGFFPPHIIIGPDTVFSPKDRHLQLRFHKDLRERLRFRAQLKSTLAQAMGDRDYMDVETPILFKSTSEGAREFIVPTRKGHLAYALPQSPQQYKQVLMASGMSGYYQFARCFRDEDHRADRQPEFTQLDMEKSFATGKHIMEDVEYVVGRAWEAMREQHVMEVGKKGFSPVKKSSLQDWKQSVQDSAKDDSQTPLYQEYPAISTPFMRMKYEDCMELYGSDKPDLRIPNRICRVDEHLDRHFISMISELKDPAVEVWKFSPRDDADKRRVSKAVLKFMDDLPASLSSKNSHSAPVALVFDSSKPLNGFSSLGPAGIDSILPHVPEDSGFSDLQNGDVVFFQARRKLPHGGGSTKLGEIRIAFYHEAVRTGLIDPDNSFKFLWVTDFPMFTRTEEGDVGGQGGAAGFSATHHPFTAPHSEEDFELLFKDPLKAKADHYDLVLNGVELGGGSRRIHVAEIQKFIFEQILQMDHHKVHEFSHLLKALASGCPPHAGFAIGFDRFVAVLSGASSVRDVIAFPKNNNGMDEFAGGPSKMTKDLLTPYKLQLLSKKHMLSDDGSSDPGPDKLF
ncbi:tRNA synthetase class II [Colletotrichum gloeosporioides Cg-14]|uniref:tRNA synthetase class II n=1 Tax=Colletotrichum gloeosporioides (strain Cg-14) TaxID=1237896 RepID=T0JYX0_COLGC|nr:tRNA synthetase class II [Colletotrichum gloeosporioides Cg-14]